MRPRTHVSARGGWQARVPFRVAAALALLIMLSPAVRAQSDDSKPEQLTKQRTDLYLRATKAPLDDLAKDVNHMVILSETCRAKYGSKACGLADKALESDKLEDRYDYYVRQPVEAHSKNDVKIDRHNWAGSKPPAATAKN